MALPWDALLCCGPAFPLLPWDAKSISRCTNFLGAALRIKVSATFSALLPDAPMHTGDTGGGIADLALIICQGALYLGAGGGEFGSTIVGDDVPTPVSFHTVVRLVRIMPFFFVPRPLNCRS